MQLRRFYPKDYEALRDLVHRAVGRFPTVVMQAGHFLLYHDDVTGSILPCLSEYLTDQRHTEIRRGYTQFPILTWRLGLRLLAALPARDKRVMVVVNDWQYLPKSVNRADFYAKHTALPSTYAEELARYVDTISLLEPKRKKSGRSTAPFYGEMNLRNRYQRHVSQLIAEKRLPPDAVLESRDKAVYCSLPDAAGNLKEAYCSGKTGDCAGEIAEMIHEACSRTGGKCLINLYPLVCRDFVERGSQLAVELLGATCETIVNIGFHSTSIRDSSHLIETAEVSLHQ